LHCTRDKGELFPFEASIFLMGFGWVGWTFCWWGMMGLIWTNKKPICLCYCQMSSSWPISFWAWR